MPLDHLVDEEHNLLVSRVTGELDAATLLSYMENSDVAFGLARMYGVLVESLQREVRVFREAGAARSWLGIAEPEGDLAA